MILLSILISCGQEQVEKMEVFSEDEENTSQQPENETEDSPLEEDEDEDEQTDPPETLELVGNYFDNFGGEHFITESIWEMDFDGEVYSYSITQYDNQQGYVIARNSDDNGPGEAGFWSRFDWTYGDDDMLWFCQTTAEAISEEAAFAFPAANEEDLSFDGCPGYGWLYLVEI